MNIQLQKLVERKGLFVDIRLLVQIVGFSHLKYFYRLCIGMLLQIIVNDFFFFLGNSNSYNNNNNNNNNLTTVH